MPESEMKPSVSKIYDLLRQRNLERALEAAQLAVKDMEAAQSATLDDQRQVKGMLALVYEMRGQHAMAIPLRQEIIDLFEAASTAEKPHPELAKVYVDMAELLSSLGDEKKALIFRDKSMAMMETAGAQDSLDYARALEQQADSCVAAADLDQAESLFKQAADIYYLYLKDDPSDYISCIGRMVDLKQYDRDEPEVAIMLQQELIIDLKKILVQASVSTLRPSNI